MRKTATVVLVIKFPVEVPDDFVEEDWDAARVHDLPESIQDQLIDKVAQIDAPKIRIAQAGFTDF